MQVASFTRRMFAPGCTAKTRWVSPFTDDLIDRSIDPARHACLDLYLPSCLPASLKFVGRSVGVMLYQMISGRLPFIPARACVTKPVSFPAAVW